MFNLCYYVLFIFLSFVSTEFTVERELICFMAPVNDFANEFYRSIEQPLIEPPEKKELINLSARGAL